MVNKRKDFDVDDTDPNKYFKNADDLQNAESVPADSVVDPTVPATEVEKCPACNGTGAVPDNLIAGKVDKWKDCPMCGRTGTAPKVFDDGTNSPLCKECNGSGHVADTFVDGLPDTYKECPTCKGKGVKLV